MLSLPLILAASTAGLVGGVHCMGMCGSLNWLLLKQLQRDQSTVVHFHANKNASLPADSISAHPRHRLFGAVLLHTGRIFSYLLIGAGFGALGAASLAWKQDWPIAKIWYLIGNLSLILIALKIMGLGLPPWLNRQLQKLTAFFSLAAKLSASARILRQRPFISGMVWGFMPCGLLYSVAPFAIFSGSALAGAVLMLIFAVCALPHLILAPLLMRAASGLRIVRYALAGALLLIGILGLYFSDMKNMPELLCITPI